MSAVTSRRRRARDFGLRGPLVERERELATLDQQLAAASDGAGSTVIIEGAAGTGKSRLMTIAGDLARKAGFQVLGAHASDFEQDFPFGVAIQLFEPGWTSAGAEDRAHFARGPARPAARLLDGALPEATLSRVDQGYPVIHALFRLAINQSSRKPLVLLVDDVQSCDRPSLRFLAYLADRVVDLPIVLILAVRTGEMTREEHGLFALTSSPGAVMLRLEQISEAGVEAFVRSAFSDADEEFVLACARVSAGNPFLLTELIDQLRTDGRAPDSQTAERLTDLAPEAIVNSVVARLGTMPADARALASAIAVLGDGARLRHAAQLASLEFPEAAQAADGLAAMHMLCPGEPLAFAHPLIRSAVTTSIPPHLLAEAHGRAARILRADDAGIETIAAHLLCSAAGVDREAVQTLRAAARRALASGSAPSAIRLLERALAETLDAEARAEVVAELGQAEALDGRPQAVERLAEAIKLTQSSGRRAELALARGGALYARQSYRQAAEVFDDALGRLEPDQKLLASELELRYVAAASLVPQLAGDAWSRSRGVLDSLNDPPTAAQRSTLAHIAMMASVRGESRASVRQLAEQAWGDGALLQDAPAAARSWPLVASALLFADDLERDLEICDAALACARTHDSPQALATVSYCSSWPLYEQGRITEAEAKAEAAMSVPPLEVGTDARVASGALACCHLQRGRLDEAERVLATVDDREVEISSQYPFLLDVRAQLRLAQHRPEDALEDATRAGECLQSQFAADNPGMVAWRSTAALAHLALGEQQPAQELAEDGLARARRAGTTRAVIRNLRVLGLATPGTTGIELLSEAVRIGESYPMRLEYVHALIELGAALRRDNQRAAARGPLRKALDLSHRCGATALAERAQTELTTSGARPRHLHLSGVEALTPSERRVADLAGGGLTTRQIAESLFVTPKTVEYHLRHVYQKLDISSRRQLPEALDQEASS